MLFVPLDHSNGKSSLGMGLSDHLCKLKASELRKKFTVQLEETRSNQLFSLFL